MPVLVSPVVPAGRLRNQAQPTLRADELTLRPWRLSDADSVVEAYCDPEIRRWHVRSMTHDEALRWLSSWSGHWRAETAAGWTVTEQDVLVGRAAARPGLLYRRRNAASSAGEFLPHMLSATLTVTPGGTIASMRSSRSPGRLMPSAAR